MTKPDMDADALRRQVVDSASAAVRRAEAAMAAGCLPEAARWIHRAYRMAPGDVTVQILFCSVIAHARPDEAIGILRALVHRLPWHREGAMALAATLLCAGRAAEAADALASMLHRMAPPATAVFHQVATGICRAAGQPGWLSLHGDGTAAVALLSPGTVRLALDGVPLGPRRLRSVRRACRSLPAGWRGAGRLAATVGDRALLGTGVRPAGFAALDGYVTADWNGAVRGWARVAADQDAVPAILAARPGEPGRPVALAASPPDAEQHDDDRRVWRFEFDGVAAAAGGELHVTDAMGRDLWGSPVWPGAERAATRGAARSFAVAAPPPAAPLPAAPPHAAPLADRFRPLPASALPLAAPPRRAPFPGARGCDVVVPVFAGLAELDRCLRTLAATLPPDARLILVNDGAPDPAIATRLAEAAGPGVCVISHARPRGFPAAVNAGLAALGPAPGRDVVILNSDTAVSGAWLERLSAAAHSDPAIGSCTPLSNDGTIVSYPAPGEPDAMPDAETLAGLAELCWQANGAAAVDLPTGVGFCMLIKGACLAETGWLREDVFAQGYGEENDWCLRAAHLGWRHVAAPGVFVGHSGGRSFGAAKALLIERNTAVLERLHPGYGRYVRAALATDPLHPARRRIDRLRLLRDAPAAGATVALVTHGGGGGVARYVAGRAAVLLEAGRRSLVLSPDDAAPGTSCRVRPASDRADRLPNLRFDLPAELDTLAALLREAGVAAFEIHHLLHHHPDVAGLPAILGVPFDVHVHDYGHWCPRISLTGRGNRYCGEPLSQAECEECVADLGCRHDPPVSVRGLRDRSAALLAGARRVAVSCDDVAARLRRQFPATRPSILAWEAPRPAAPEPPSAVGGAAVHVVVAGAIGVEKGYDVLLACARDAARRGLPLRFTVVGHTIDDDRLMDTGRVFVTGPFAEDDGLALVRQQAGTVGFVPSVCPETWCFALSLLWEAGLPVLGFALGAQGERIGRSGRGWVVPLGLPPAKINDALVSRARGSNTYACSPMMEVP